jgi:hypothetical protein
MLNLKKIFEQTQKKHEPKYKTHFEQNVFFEKYDILLLFRGQQLSLYQIMKKDKKIFTWI